MKLRNAVTASRWRPAVLALVLTGALGGTAFAAVSNLTLDSTAALSPGMMRATLTGTVTCDPGETPFMNGQIVQSRNASGFGSTTAVCDGTPQPYAIDVLSSGFFSPAGVFKPGKASAQVTTFICEPWAMLCTTKFVDATIRLTK